MHFGQFAALVQAKISLNTQCAKILGNYYY